MTRTAELDAREPLSLVKRMDAPLSGRPEIAALASGLLLWTAFPPVAWSWLAWVALVPLFRLATLRTRAWRLYLSAWLSGLVFWVLALEWIRTIDPSAWTGWLLMALFFSAWPALFLLVARAAVLGLKIPLMMAAPIIWVGLEYARAHILSGFPWYYLAHSQYLVKPLIQISDVTGALGVSFLIAAANALVVDLLSLPLLRRSKTNVVRFCPRQYVRVCLVTILVGSCFCYGGYRLATARFSDGPRLALLQTNIEQRRKMKGDPGQIVTLVEALVGRAVAHERPDLIVWPETSYPFGYIKIEPGVEFETVARQLAPVAPNYPPKDWAANAPLIDAELHAWTDRAGVPMLIGSLFYHHEPQGLARYNAAILFEPKVAAIQTYNKMHLVPFGEYVPFIETLPWLTALTPYHGERPPSLSFGARANILQLGPYRLAATICFEDTVPQVVNQFFHGEPQPDVLINLSNDGWFHGTAELDMHLAIGVFRAIEHRVPLARAVNTGLTALVDGNGEIRDALPKETSGVLSVTVPLDPRTTLYSRFGDWLGFWSLAVVVGLVPVRGLYRLKAVKSPI